MLDKSCFDLLKFLSAECKDCGYKIFSTEELARASGCRLEKDLSEILQTLTDREYICVKYQDEREICLSTTQKGRLFEEKRIDAEVEKLRLERKYFVYAFSGALVGGLVSGIIALIITLVGGA